MASLINFYNMEYKSNCRYKVYLKVDNNENISISVNVKDVTLPKIEFGALELKYGNSSELVSIPKYGSNELSITVMESNKYAIYTLLLLLKNNLFKNYEFADAEYNKDSKIIDIIIDEYRIDQRLVLVRHNFGNCKLTSNDGWNLDYQDNGPTYFNLTFCYESYKITYLHDSTFYGSKSEGTTIKETPTISDLNEYGYSKTVGTGGGSGTATGDDTDVGTSTGTNTGNTAKTQNDSKIDSIQDSNESSESETKTKTELTTKTETALTTNTTETSNPLKADISTVIRWNNGGASYEETKTEKYKAYASDKLWDLGNYETDIYTSEELHRKK